MCMVVKWRVVSSCIVLKGQVGIILHVICRAVVGNTISFFIPTHSPGIRFWVSGADSRCRIGGRGAAAVCKRKDHVDGVRSGQVGRRFLRVR